MADIGNLAVTISANPSAFVNGVDAAARRATTFNRQMQSALTFDVSAASKSLDELQRHLATIKAPAIDASALSGVIGDIQREFESLSGAAKDVGAEVFDPIRERIEQLGSMSASEASEAVAAIKDDLAILDELQREEERRRRQMRKDVLARKSGIGQTAQAPTLSKSIAQTGRVATDVVQGNVSGLVGSLSTLGGPVGVAAVAAIAVGQVVGAMKGLAQRASENVTQLQRTADALEGSTRAARTFGLAAAMSGRSVDTVTRAFSSLRASTTRIAEADFGTRQAFETSGIDVDALTMAAPEDALREFGAQLQAIEDPSRRLSVAMRVLGDDWRAVTTVLSANALDDAQATIDEVGFEISTEDLETYREEMAKLDYVYTQFTTMVGGELTPLFTDLSGIFQDMAPVIVGVIRGLTQTVSTLRQLSRVGGLGSLNESQRTSLTSAISTILYNAFTTPAQRIANSIQDAANVMENAASSSAPAPIVIQPTQQEVLAARLRNRIEDMVGEFRRTMDLNANVGEGLQVVRQLEIQAGGGLDQSGFSAAARSRVLDELQPEFQRVRELEQQLRELPAGGFAPAQLQQELEQARATARIALERRRELDIIRQGPSTIARFRTPMQNFLNTLAHEGDGLRRLQAQLRLGAIDETTFNLGVLDSLMRMDDLTQIGGNPMAAASTSVQGSSMIIQAQREQARRGEDPQARVERILTQQRVRQERQIQLAEDMVAELRRRGIITDDGAPF